MKMKMIHAKEEKMTVMEITTKTKVWIWEDRHLVGEENMDIRN